MSCIKYFCYRLFTISHRYKVSSSIKFNTVRKLTSQSVCLSYQRKIRPDFSLIAQTNRLAGKLPYSIEFNTRGDLIAVGYSKQPVTEVLYTTHLQTAYTPDVSGLPVNEDISSVGFS